MSSTRRQSRPPRELTTASEVHDVKRLSRLSEASDSSYATAKSTILTGDAHTPISVHGSRNSIDVRPISSNGKPESISWRRTQCAEPPALTQIVSLGDSIFRRVLRPSRSASPSPDVTSSPGEGEISYSRRTRSPGRGFCVLCLDGGGCRGYISLLILKQLLRQLQPKGPLYPYLYFDVICGTSTGGLIAILLGVLHLDVDTALRMYKVLMREVFSVRFSLLRYWLKDAGYSRKPLKRAIAKILKEHGNGRTLMQDPGYDRGCRCFVTTTHCVGEGRHVLALRSYMPPGGIATIPDDHDWTCDEAAIATTAAAGFFKRQMIAEGENRFFFEDAGGHRTNNPSKFAVDECQKLDAADSQLNAVTDSLFISLGTGTWTDIHTACGFCGLFKNKIATLKASLRHATSVREVHEWMQKEAGERNMSYFRLNPSLGGKIGLADAAEIPAMEASVMDYFEEEERKSEFRECAAQLKQFQTTERTMSQD